MSQYLSLYLKNKENSEISICLGYFCTTPARQIANLGAFPYSSEDIKLDTDSFKSYISDIKNEIDEWKNLLNNRIKNKEELKQDLYKCSSKEVAEMIMEKIEDNESSIQGIKEELEDWNYRLDLINYISGTWEDNKDEWDLYYSNC